MTKRQQRRQRAREGFFLKHGRFPTDSELRSLKKQKHKPKLFFGYNTVSR